MWIAVLLVSLRFILSVFYYADRPDEFYLWTGRGMVVFAAADKWVPVKASPAVQELRVGTRCVVIKDYADDQDDCLNTRRLITVMIAEGSHEGEVVGVPRANLRHQGWW